MKKYRIGIIGYGGFGKFLHHWWDKLENVEVVAIADSKVREDNPEHCTVYRHWEELVAAGDIDIVSIVTPPLVHAEIAAAAMRANKHVLLEKPVAINIPQIDVLLQARQEAGRVIMVDHMLRYNPIVKALTQLSRTGTLGKLRHAEVSNYAQDASLPPDHWFWNRDFSGGIFIEHGVHFIDIINSLTTQRYEEVQGTSHWRNEGQEDQVAAMIKYNEGLIAHHYHAFSGPGFFEQTTIRLAFDLAKIEVEGWIPMQGKITALVNNPGREALKALPGWREAKAESVQTAGDLSRPEGWGDTSPADHSNIYCGGIGYDADKLISGSFQLDKSKGEIYGQCVQDLLQDMICKIEDPEHITRVTLDDACESLRIAILATQQ